nr:DUF4861 family protein [uncultured Undibacterium sp.]
MSYFIKFICTLCGVLLCNMVTAANKLTITVKHSLDIARPAQMVEVPWRDIVAAIPEVNSQKLIIMNASGVVLPYQVIKPDYDEKGIAAGFTELLFQHDFIAGEKTAIFTLAVGDSITPPFETKTCARFVPERLDDFAWENDRIGHRTYGNALSMSDEKKIGKEVLTASGIDIWSKKVRYCIIDRWYSRDNYHHDDGEGLDIYKTGTTRGTGGTGIWDGKKLHTSGNFKDWKIVANGPIRTVFELRYSAWDVNGIKVSETKRFTVDAGHNLDLIESTFNFKGTEDLTVGIGISRSGAEKAEFVKAAEVFRLPSANTLAQWEEQKTNGAMGHAIIIANPVLEYGEDTGNQLVFTKVSSGQPLRYFAGAGWTKSGDYIQKEDWLTYIEAEAIRINSPLTITLSKN